MAGCQVLPFNAHDQVPMLLEEVPWRGLIITSAATSKVGQCSRCVTPWKIELVTNQKRISKCLVHFPEEAEPHNIVVNQLSKEFTSSAVPQCKTCVDFCAHAPHPNMTFNTIQNPQRTRFSDHGQPPGCLADVCCRLSFTFFIIFLPLLSLDHHCPPSH